MFAGWLIPDTAYIMDTLELLEDYTHLDGADFLHSGDIKATATDMEELARYRAAQEGAEIPLDEVQVLHHYHRSIRFVLLYCNRVRRPRANPQVKYGPKYGSTCHQ